MKIISLCLLLFPLFTKAQSTITGKVNYGFTETGERPDNAAKIYVIKYDEQTAPLYETIKNFVIAKENRGVYSNLIQQYRADSLLVVKYRGKNRYKIEYDEVFARTEKMKPELDERNKKIQAAGAETKAQFEALDARTSTALSKTKYQQGKLETVSDASGNYSVKAPAGHYIILFQSTARTGFTSSEVNGKVFIAEVEVKDGETATVNAKFPFY